ncbi:hypothetical protein IMSAG249_02423 [Lachnospiraceae bacterium]|nr:hypothetical protein IMSAG249_02423 [Lachnospiraceae bacterium]
MTTITLKGRVLKENNQRLTLKERIVRSFTTYFEEYGVKVANGMLMMSGNTSGVLAYSMLEK